MTAAAPSWRGYLYVLLVVAIWTGFVVISRLAGKGALNAFDVTALRFGVAAMLLVPVLAHRGLGSLRDPRRLLLCTLTGGIGYALLVYSAFYFAPAAHGSILLSGMLPFLIAVVAWLLLGERPGPQKSFALALIAGGMLCMAFQTFREEAHPTAWIGDVLFVTAASSWATFTVLVRRWNVAAWDATIGTAVLSALIYLPIYLLFLPKQIAQAPLWEIVLQAGYQGVLVVVVSMVLFTKAIAELGPTRLSAVMATVPALSALLAWAVLGEPLLGLVPHGIVLVTLGALAGATAGARAEMAPR